MVALSDQRNAVAAAFDSPVMREIVEQNESINRKMQEMVALIPKFESIIPLELANEALSHSIFGSEFVVVVGTDAPGRVSTRWSCQVAAGVELERSTGLSPGDWARPATST